jgi:hypothetical protein
LNGTSLLKGATVPTLGDQGPGNRGIDWLGIARILILQVLVLLALAGAFIRYLDWSSDRAWTDFIAASQAPAQRATPQPQSFAPVRTVKVKAPCARRA